MFFVLAERVLGVLQRCCCSHRSGAALPLHGAPKKSGFGVFISLGGWSFPRAEQLCGGEKGTVLLVRLCASCDLFKSVPALFVLWINKAATGKKKTKRNRTEQNKKTRKQFTSSCGLSQRFVFLSLNGDAMKSIFYFYFLRYWNKCLELLPFGFICSLTMILFSAVLLAHHFCSPVIISLTISQQQLRGSFVLLKSIDENRPVWGFFYLLISGIVAIQC